jgi:hypothetical protein
MDDLSGLARLVDALRPWLGHMVVVGGWAHRLHRFHPWASPPSYLPLMTRDADLAFSLTAPLAGDIGVALRTAGFQEDLSGDETPPIAQYRLGEEHAGFYAEFLAPLLGDGHRRDGSSDVTVAKAGITAQKLRYLDLLLVHPWAVALDAAVAVPLSKPADVMLPNPVSFIAQKLLIQRRRKPEKQAQDALYVHDTLQLFGAELTGLKMVWLEQVRPTLPAKTAKLVERLQREQFDSVTDVIRNAARIPQDRSLTPEYVRGACAGRARTGSTRSSGPPEPQVPWACSLRPCAAG